MQSVIRKRCSRWDSQTKLYYFTKVDKFLFKAFPSQAALSCHPKSRFFSIYFPFLTFFPATATSLSLSPYSEQGDNTHSSTSQNSTVHSLQCHPDLSLSLTSVWRITCADPPSPSCTVVTVLSLSWRLKTSMGLGGKERYGDAIPTWVRGWSSAAPSPSLAKPWAVELLGFLDCMTCKDLITGWREVKAVRVKQWSSHSLAEGYMVVPEQLEWGKRDSQLFPSCFSP